jgi:hypothetical protein
MKTAEDLQAESLALLSRVKPLLDSIDMAIRREAGAKGIKDSLKDLEEIANGFRKVQDQIRKGIQAR